MNMQDLLLRVEQRTCKSNMYLMTHPIFSVFKASAKAENHSMNFFGLDSQIPLGRMGPKYRAYSILEEGGEKG